MRLLKTLARNPLLDIPCFFGLDEGATRVVEESLQENLYSKDQVVFLQDEPCPGLFVIKSGRVKLYRSSPDGDEHIVRLLGSGSCFECAPLFDGGPNPVSAQAMEDSVLYFLPSRAFRAILASSPEVTSRFVSVLASRLRVLLRQVEDMSLRPVNARLARLLLDMSERKADGADGSSEAKLNQQHLACMIGCTRQMVNASLGKLARNGFIRKEGRRVVVIRPEELRRIADHSD
ncbi:MAG: Crp/Fnr family transcriptional regulator [Chloroflexi bacterium]|nr:Crp/Fnr family transcriptional regulator [Chloroflexota bacterium]